MKHKRRYKKNLLNMRPEIARKWNYEKNRPLLPEEVCVGSHTKKVWWKCEKGHEWQATVGARTVNGTGCPVCSNRVIVEGYNDLQTLMPALAKEWNHEKNGDLKPTQVGKGSNKRVWWKCEKGHEFEVKISDRASRNTSCPVCSNRVIVEGYNDLQTLMPEIAKEWNHEKNGELKPTEVGKGSHKVVWWKCEEGHEFKTMIKNRTSRNTKCPFCARRQRKKDPSQEEIGKNKIKGKSQ